MSEIERWTLGDGRRAERRIISDSDKQITELYVEDERPLKLQQRVIETSKPVIVERRIETIDSKGEVVEQRVESIEPKVKMNLVEHTKFVEKEEEVTAQSTGMGSLLTKDDMIEAIKEALSVKDEPKQPAKKTPDNYMSSQLQSLGIVDEIKSKINETTNNTNTNENYMIFLIVIEVLVLLYIKFYM